MQPLSRAMRYCAYQERSQQEVRDKLYSWELHQKEVEEIISTLINEGYLKEERFALAYASGKFRIKKWGRNKIRQALKEKRVSEALIKSALSSIDETEYDRTLTSVIQERSKKVTDANPLKRNYKIASYVIQRGFESDLVWGKIKEE